MYFVVFQDKVTKVRRYVAFSDQGQFEEDYSPDQGDIIAQGITKEKAIELCKKTKEEK